MGIGIIQWAPGEKEKLAQIKDYIREDLDRAYTSNNGNIHTAIDVVQVKLRRVAPRDPQQRRKYEFIANEAGEEWLAGIGQPRKVSPSPIFDVIRGMVFGGRRRG